MTMVVLNSEGKMRRVDYVIIETNDDSKASALLTTR